MRPRLLPASTALTVIVAVGVALALHATRPGEQYINEPLHSSLEAIGGCFAIAIAVLLVVRWLEDGPGHFLWMSTSLFSMGVLDIAHSCCERSPAFFWSRALPTLLGGLLMALVWLPSGRGPRKLIWRRPPLIAAIAAIPVGVLLVLSPTHWPNAFAPDGSYFLWAKTLNVIGGAAFAVAALFFLRRNREGGHHDADLVFANQCVIFAIAGFLFGLSHVWDAVWWLFHVLRLAAYVVALKYIIDVYGRAMKESEELRQIEIERRLLGIVGHDLRNPLNAIQLSSELLQGMELPAPATKVLRRLTNASDRMQRLIAELLDFSRSRHGGSIPIHRTEIDLHSLCSTVREEFAASHPNAVTTCELSGNGVGEWDRERLHQLLVNLVENAIKHGDKTSPVVIRTGAEGDRVTLEVHSRGKPIPSDLLPHVFEPFRTGGSHQSYGLGLFIVREIARGHGGEIFVESSDAAGTTFRVILPRTAAAAVA